MIFFSIMHNCILLASGRKMSSVIIVDAGQGKDWEQDMRDISMALCGSDTTSKHLDCHCLHNAKGTMHFGGIGYLYEKGISFLLMCELFWRWTMVLCWTIQDILAKAPRVLRMSTQSVTRNEPKQLRRIFVISVALTLWMGEEFSFEAWASELRCCAEL